MIGNKVSFYNNRKQGIVLDKFLDIDSRTVETNELVYGFPVKKQEYFQCDFYLILGDDGKTYKIRCNEVNLISK